jgi:Polyphosphate kinase N-terminal domain
MRVAERSSGSRLCYWNPAEGRDLRPGTSLVTVSATPLVGDDARQAGAEALGSAALSVGELAPVLLDRDLSWLEFNRRVLQEALDERTPLLERVKFLAIFTSNLDEFFMKRIALIRPMAGDTGVAAEESRERLGRVRETVISLLDEQATCYREVLRPRLAEHGVRLVAWADLSDEQRGRGLAAVRLADLAGFDPAEP